MVTEKAAPVTRMGGAERRELVLAAATRAFAAGGYAGTSTDAVAKEAGVSQPYVVRMFGTKLELFLQVHDRAIAAICAAFAAEIEAAPFDPQSPDDWGRLGDAYTTLLQDRDLLLVMMHGFTAAAAVPDIGTAARECVSEVVRTLEATGGTDEQIRDFFAQGMLLNVLVAIRAPEHFDQGGPLARLATCAFGDALSTVR
ncbi:TetR/AcrR family transcriptional regulator [Nakamurella lactea]|uniref:TetR/AcrR family transcriptional regulator n=1 Tax=Nakamurella lactea TaxID=459515 RepID=UPI000425E45B|nr:TetR/AcrR family transcriptional regulator [Nakamurella lactea]